MIYRREACCCFNRSLGLTGRTLLGSKDSRYRSAFILQVLLQHSDTIMKLIEQDIKVFLHDWWW